MLTFRLISILFFSILISGLFSNLEAKAQKNTVIAVSDFKNDTGNTSLDYLQSGLARSLSTKLAGIQNIKLVERSQFTSLLKELGLASTGLIDSSTAAKLGKALGANKIVIGELVGISFKYRLNIRIVETETVQIIMAFSEDASSLDDLFKMVDRVALRIINSINPIQISSEDLNKQIDNVNISPINFWGSLGAGLYAMYGISPLKLSTQLALENQGNLYSLSLFDFNAIFNDNDFSYSEISLMYGRRFKVFGQNLLVSAGIGYGFQKRYLSEDVNYLDISHGTTFPMEVSLMLPYAQNFSFNLKSKASIGSVSYAGVSAEVSFGKMEF